MPATLNTQIGDPTVKDTHLYQEKEFEKTNKKETVKLVEAEIEKWAKELFLVVYPNAGFPLDASTILTGNERTKLAVEVLTKNIKDMDDLRRTLGQWCFMDQYGSTLLKVLEDASKKHKSSSNKARAHVK